MPRSKRKHRYYQLQLDLQHGLLNDIIQRTEKDDIYNTLPRAFLAGKRSVNRDPFWTAIINKDLY